MHKKMMLAIAVVVLAITSAMAQSNPMVGGQEMYPSQKHYSERSELGRSHDFGRGGKGSGFG
jgi:hypothetical protein